MPFTSLSSRIGNLPLVLAGPVLRRTEPDSVTVWLATRRQVSNLTLEIIDPTGPSTLMGGNLISSLALGDNLHIAVITASGATLTNDRIYHYDIVFGSEGNKRLNGIGVLSSTSGGIDRITYGGAPLPSFVLPPNNLNDLRILHGSCRKPHGGDKDALLAVHQILESSHNDLNTRPHQLMLTGDQIYADDVAGVLLYMLQDAGETLLGWTEDVPDANAADLLKGSADRNNLINKKARLTTEDGKYHLVRLVEFYAMYLFVWSDVLWAPDSEIDFLVGFYSLDRDQARAVKVFRSAVADVRRALANIPCYMIFDDHEITDDWFLNGAWCNTILGEPGDPSTGNQTARRIIANGIAAFAVFQAWGNMPSFYASPPGSQLLQALADLNNHGGTTPEDWETIDELVLPNVISDGSGTKLDHSFTWHFSIDFAPYQLVALDTRTRRNFRSARAGAGLISQDVLNAMLPPRSGSRPLTIVLSGAPVIGHPFLEETLQPLLTHVWGTADTDYEAWSFDRGAFERFFQRLGQYNQALILSGDVHYAFSAGMSYWDEHSGGGASPNRSRFVQLTASSFKNSDTKTLLVGNNYIPINLLFLGNHSWLGWDSPGEHVETINVRQMLINTILGLPAGATLATLLPLIAALPRQRVRVNRMHGGPAMRRLEAGDRIRAGHDPQWRYRIEFMDDGRNDSARGIPPAAISPSLPLAIALATVHAVAVSNAGRSVVGKDNLGLVKFNWTGANQQVIHQLFYNLPIVSSSDFRPYTEHMINFQIPAAGDPRPGE